MITKEQFQEFLTEYTDKIDNDTLTLDDIYAIGLKYKLLPHTEKNWAALNEALHTPKDSGEQLRAWVKHRQEKDGTLPKNPDYITIPDEPVTPLNPEKTVEEQKAAELYKTMTTARDAVREYRSELRKDARLSVLEDRLVEAIKTMPPLKFQRQGGMLDPNDAREGIFLLSDWHIGSYVNNFYNKFDYDIAVKRVQKLAEEVIKYCELFHITTLHVLDLGDLIEGEIHVTVRVTNELNTCDQVIQATELLAQFLTTVAEHVDSIEYRSCVGNHDRVIQNWKESTDDDNLIYLINWALKMRLELNDVENVHFEFENMSDTMGMFKLWDGRKVGYAHGHTFATDTAYQNFTGALQSYVDYICLGHFHSVKTKEFNSAKVYVNGSLKGVDTYAMQKSLYSRPSQTLIVFDGKNDLDFRINLD